VGAENPAVAVHIRGSYVQDAHIGIAGRYQVGIPAGEGTLHHTAAIHQFHVRAAVVAYRDEFEAHGRGFEAGRHAVIGVIIQLDHAVGTEMPQQRRNADDLIAPPGQLHPSDGKVLGVGQHGPREQFGTDRIGLKRERQVLGALANDFVDNGHRRAGVDETAKADVDAVFDVLLDRFLEGGPFVNQALGLVDHGLACLFRGCPPPLERRLGDLIEHLVPKVRHIPDQGSNLLIHRLPPNTVFRSTVHFRRWHTPGARASVLRCAGHRKTSFISQGVLYTRRLMGTQGAIWAVRLHGGGKCHGKALELLKA